MTSPGSSRTFEVVETAVAADLLVRPAPAAGSRLEPRTGARGRTTERGQMRAAVTGSTRQSRRRYERVVEQILELVESEGLDQGQALPTERELAERFGVSRNVLRQAFGVLEERGLLRSIRGSGRYLR